MKHQDGKSAGMEARGRVAGGRGVVRLGQGSWQEAVGTKPGKARNTRDNCVHGIQCRVLSWWVLIGDLKKTTEPKLICKRVILIPFPTSLLYRPAVSIIHRTECDSVFKTRVCFAEREEKAFMKQGR